MLKSGLIFKKRSNFTGKFLGRILRIRFLRIKNVKLLDYCFYVNPNYIVKFANLR